MRTANPAFRAGIFEGAMRELAPKAAASTTMTVRGTAIKTAITLSFCVLTTGVSYAFMRDPATRQIASIGGVGGLIVGLVLAITLAFKPTAARFLAIPYAVCEGLFLGVITYVAANNGLRAGNAIGEVGVFNAVAMTFGTMAAMLTGYAAGFLKPNAMVRNVIMIATAGVMFAYLINMVLRLIPGMGGIGFIHSAGPMGIAFSVFVVILAAANLLLDFHYIEEGVERGAPKAMEWYGSYALLVTLVWLYIEFLRLLSKLRK